jgi:NDP-sugar pyrophosphorylase family protein
MVIVIPMAGRGQRFVDAGYELPKPLISVRGAPMYSWALRSLPLDAASRLVFVCLEEHLVERGLEADIRERYRSYDPVVVSVTEVTGGQLCTVLEARELLPGDEALLIYNADTLAISSPHPPWLGTAPGIDGSLGVFHTDAGDHWSFVLPDASGRVVRTAEKQRISSWASTGLYHFQRASAFIEAADDAIAQGETSNGEYYVAPLYNRLIAVGDHIVMDEASEVWPLGTPAELDRFLGVAP